ncbi:malto-oligosyltrehalose trehalohydrolase [Subtercola frigoramans]|uniref:Malto-oligosyltrehalose trehalohydrolase n=1 Tax=Subtercola frigoramans TaxID=120298 RepID=A0ABS2L6S0_9MICO|nr:malto-oligosyltrehalose trehalohydrolase [Subtercola frigoramans]MBM7472783.1 maltooligosyltrehalose trehalohydrolase [Subtercola frigoramans]
MALQKFDVWAPRADGVTLTVRQPGSAEPKRITMSPRADGWFAVPANVVADLETAGDIDYGYTFSGVGDADLVIPDPRSRRQPDGVHGLSRTFDPTQFEWTDSSWKGRQLAGGEIYELHIGTFTPEGTLDAAIAKLDHLVSIGVDFVELLPVNGFNGTHNWGYDGVLWFTVHEGYGGPAAYQRFVDACHAKGLAVIQDVVYNHLGPSGNYLPMFGPYINDQSSNTWGSSINLDGEGSEEVRRFIVDNALMWLNDYHVDGLRLDAVHALHDESEPHLLAQMSTEVDTLSSFLGRPLTLIAESDLNDPIMFTPRESRGYGLSAQWSDDFHHALHVALTGEVSGYYADFEPLSALGKVMTEGFFHNGTWSSFREQIHGKPIDTEHTLSWRLVVANQNHDQIGNRATGDRLSASLTDGQLAIAAVLTMLGPFTPMLFMGEEWAASTPWQFFTSHPEPELGEATAKGRIAEFAKMGWDESAVPDPQDPETFERSKLDWAERAEGRHARVLRLYQELARLRRSLPEFTDPRFTEISVRLDEDADWFEITRGRVSIIVNFSDVPIAFDAVGIGAGEPAGTILLNTSDALEGTEFSGAPVTADATIAPHSATIILRP